MTRARVALLLMLALAGCSRRNVEVDPQIDCGDQALIDVDDDCGDLDSGDCVVGNVTFDARDGELLSVQRVTGSLTITGSDRVLGLSLRRVGGCLVVATEGAAEVSLPALVDVGRLRVTDLVTQQVLVPALRRGDVEIVGGDLTALSLPNHRAGSIVLRDTSGLQAVSAGTVTGGIVVDGAPDLVDVTLPALVDAADVVLEDTALTRLSLPLVERIGSLVVVDNPLLATIDLPALTQIEEQLLVVDNDRVADADVCGLVGLVSEAGSLDHDARCP